MKIQKYLRKTLMLLFFLFLFLSKGVKAQNIDFIYSPDSATAGTNVTFTNTSDSMITNAMFVWKFENSKVLITHPPTFADEYDTTRLLSNKIYKSFVFPNSYNVTLYCIDSISDTIIATRTKSIIIIKYNCECSQFIAPNACNLVCNNSFEIYNESYISAWGWRLGNLGAASCAWSFATNCFSHGCPDLFNEFSNEPDVDIPSNLYGYQAPLSNNSNTYAGFLAYRDADGYREYIQKDLYPNILVAGQKYIVGMYVSLSDNSRYAIKDIGIALTNTCYQCCSLTDHFRYTYEENGSSICDPIQPKVKANSIMNNKTDWVLISDTIIGNNENTLTIGNFSDNYITNQNMYDYGSSYIIHYPGHDEYDAYYYVDSVFITIYHEGQNNNDTICIGNSITLTSSIVPEENLYAWTYVWQPGNIYTNSITVSPTQNTTYICIATDAYEGCSISDTFNIIIGDPPPSPIITGNNNNCDAEAIYTVSNPNPNYTYLWRIGDDNYSSSFQQNGSSITVAWTSNFYANGNAENTWIYVDVTDNNTGCTSKDSIKIWKCCRKSPDSPAYNDTIINDASIFSITPTPYFNGNIIIGQSMVVTAIPYILMGPEAKIIVNPPYTFTVSGSTLMAGCKYMWDGIYVTDSNAKVIIQNSGTTASNVLDAKNAIVSENGGKFELKNSKFYNNYTSVLVRDYQNFLSLPAHKGKIYGCTFTKLGTGMIAPYLNIKPRHGIYLDNVYNITVGDSTQAANIFRNVFCGIASYNSIVNVYKNDFRNIKVPVLCQGGPNGDYTGLYCETAIHSVSTSSDRYHYNFSQLKSGAGANSRNTFDTCTNAIYTYTTLTTVNNNKVKNTNIGVYCREATTGSYVINSAFKNNTLVGIKFINILPLTKKITIKYDSILDPTSGIYLSNITSAVNPTARSVVSNNYISNAKNTSVYGIYLEKCDRIEAYCNMVTRITIPSTAYRLYIRGIQISQCENALIHDNTSERIGLSIKGAGSLLGTQFKCNTSNGSYNGFYFDAAYNSVQTAISKQGDSTHPTDNKWTFVSGYYGIDGTYSTPGQKKWFYRNVGGTPTYIPTEGSNLIGKIILSQAYLPVAPNCTTCTYGYMMAGNSIPIDSPTSNSLSTNSDLSEMDAIMNESNSYNELDESFRYFEKQYAFHKLDANNQSLNETTGNYYYDLKNSNIGRFENVYSRVVEGHIEDAKMLNAQISPTNTIEQYRKWVNAVYFDFIVPQKPIPQNTIDELNTLASTSPFVNGDAVFSARAIVGYTEPLINTKSIEQEDPTNEPKSDSLITINVYPNPAENIINVELRGINEEKCKFVIRNVLGIALIEKEIKADGTVTSIDISKLQNGLYLYEVLNTMNLKINSASLLIAK
jgi:hypothetical protein